MIENDSATLKMMRKEIDGLKDDMKSLRRKYRRLEETVGKSGGAVGQPGPSEGWRKFRRLEEAVGKSDGAVGQPGPSEGWRKY